jgi:hypothetical protein
VNSLTGRAVSRRFAGPTLGERRECVGKRVGVDDIGIGVIFDPILQLGVALMLGVVDRFEELGIAPAAADVAGFTSSSVILRRAMVSALMPQVYGAPSPPPSATATAPRGR